VTAKQIAEKRYVVKLSDEERERLNTLIRAGKHPARQLTKARYERNGTANLFMSSPRWKAGGMSRSPIATPP
jgi:hypothetical protein